MALAPMAGVTDLPFRRLVMRFGAALVVSEMVASEEIVRSTHAALAKSALGLGVEKTAVQLAGREARWMSEAARMVEANGARLIDINMGCPAKKVVNGYSGSALLRDLDHALALIEAVVSSVDVPVTLKTRLGWDHSSLNAPELARRAEAAGISMITIHGRTRCQFYKGWSDWQAIRAVKDAVNVPVIANGDIVSPDSAQEALRQSGADGVMVGRGARGRPWLLADIAGRLEGRSVSHRPGGDGLAEMAMEHLEDSLSFYGRPLGLWVARKHLGSYMEEAGTPRTLRREILTAREPSQVFSLLGAALSLPPEAA